MHFQTVLRQLQTDLQSNTERGGLVRAAGITAGLKIGATLLAFAASLIYARTLGPHNYGMYSYVIAWIAILTIPSSLGIPRYLVREGARQSGSLRWLCRWADKRVLLGGLLVACLLVGAVFVPTTSAGWLFVIAAPLPLLANLIGVRVALLQAQGLVARSQWPHLLFSPALMLSIITGLWLWRGQFSTSNLILLTALTTLVSLGINELQLRRTSGFRESNLPGLVKTRQALPFMWLGMLFLVNSRTDLIMIGTLKGVESAGIYAVAMRISEFVPFFLIAANTVLAPRITQLYQRGDHILLQRLIAAAASRVFYFTLPVALLFILFAQPLIHYLFGTAFITGAIALQILALAQLFNVLAGPTGIILNMTGHESLSAKGVGISVVVNITLNAILIPFFDITGAAIATGVSMIVLNCILWYWIRHRLGLHPSALGY